jgi:hypothetical protein
MTRLIAYLRTIISPPQHTLHHYWLSTRSSILNRGTRNLSSSAGLFTLSRFVGTGLVTARIYISRHSHSFCRCQGQAHSNLIEPPRYAGNNRQATTFFGHPPKTNVAQAKLEFFLTYLHGGWA